MEVCIAPVPPMGPLSVGCATPPRSASPDDAPSSAQCRDACRDACLHLRTSQAGTQVQTCVTALRLGVTRRSQLPPARQTFPGDSQETDPGLEWRGVQKGSPSHDVPKGASLSCRVCTHKPASTSVASHNGCTAKQKTEKGVRFQK